MPEEPAKTEAAPVPPKKKLPLTLGIIGGVAVLQGVGFFVFFKFFGSKPQAALAETNHVIESVPASQPAEFIEVSLLKSYRVPNCKSGRTWVYDLDVIVVVPAKEKDKVERLADERAGEIADRVSGLVRAAPDSVLREDDLRVLRNQFLEGLREIMGDEKLIQRVLIPRFVPLRAE